MASAEGCTQLTGVVNASAVVVRRIPGVASTRSKTAWRCAFDRATTRHNRSPEPVTLCTSRTSGMSDRPSITAASPPCTISSVVKASTPEADRTEIDDGPEAGDGATRLQPLQTGFDGVAGNAQLAGQFENIGAGHRAEAAHKFTLDVVHEHSLSCLSAW